MLKLEMIRKLSFLRFDLICKKFLVLATNDTYSIAFVRDKMKSVPNYSYVSDVSIVSRSFG